MKVSLLLNTKDDIFDILKNMGNQTVIQKNNKKYTNESQWGPSTFSISFSPCHFFSETQKKHLHIM